MRTRAAVPPARMGGGASTASVFVPPDAEDPVGELRRLRERAAEWLASSQHLHNFLEAEFLADLRQQLEQTGALEGPEASDDGQTMSPEEARQHLERISTWMQESAAEMEDVIQLSEMALRPEDRPDLVIFLDVDGVLHPLNERGFPLEADYDELMERGDYITGSAPVAPVVEGEFLSHCMERLRVIVESTGANIVLSSTWRETPDQLAAVDEQLENHSMSPCVSKTPILSAHRSRRAAEILAWVDTNRPRAFVVLDDNNLVQYAKDGTVFYTSTATNTQWPLYVGVSVNQLVSISNIQYTALP